MASIEGGLLDFTLPRGSDLEIGMPQARNGLGPFELPRGTTDFVMGLTGLDTRDAVNILFGGR